MELQAKDLRIGNWVQTKQTDKQFQINEINDSSLIESCYKPIPLTEEWLLKFGFNKGDVISTEVQFFTKKDWSVKTWHNKTCILFKGNNSMKTDIKHVHQLQNLYYALTNEELQINKVNK